MPTLRKRKVNKRGQDYLYWVVDFSHTENGRQRRKQRHFKKKTDAELFRAEIEHPLAHARFSGLEVPMGPPDVTLTEWLDRFVGAIKPNCCEKYFKIVLYTVEHI